MPPSARFREVLLVIILGGFSTLSAQPTGTFLALGEEDSVTVSGYSGQPGASAPVLQADWSGIDGPSPRFTVHDLGGIRPGVAMPLTDLVVTGVEQYLDQRIRFTRQGVAASLPVDRIANGVNRMIALASTHFGTPHASLSEATHRQLARVASIDWSRATFGVDGEDDQEKYIAIYFYVRAQRQELERNLLSDLLPLAGVDLARTTAGQAQPGQEQVPTVCSTVFDDENYLCALDLGMDTSLAVTDVELTDAMLSVIATQAASPNPEARAYKPRKRDRWLKEELDAINRRIDQADQRKELWALRDRMDDIEGRLDDLGLQVEHLNRGQEQRAENPVASLSALTGKNVTIRFGLGSFELGVQEKALLEEVARAMGQDAGGRLLVTGYADASGSPALNLALSERRAKAVRDHLLKLGIGGDRVLLNYQGAGRSTGADPAERRVELDWLR